MTRFSLQVAVVICLSAIQVTAQGSRATLTGHITDSSQGSVPKATVKAENSATNEVHSTITTTGGEYTIPFLAPGTYVLSVEAPGFKKFVRENIRLYVDQTATIDAILEVGAVSEQVTVTSAAPLLDAANPESGTVVDNQKVDEFPLNSRNTYMLGQQAAGLSWNGVGQGLPFDSGNIERWSINGSLIRAADYLLDGAPNNAHAGANYYDYVPMPDSVQEFKMITTPYDAQYGKTGGGVISILTKSGTNTLHGAAYEFMRRNALDANSFQNNAEGQPRSGHRLDQFGFEVDGPVYLPKIYNGKNKTFFMINWEDYLESTPSPLTLSVPEMDMRNGDFSKLTNSNGQLITIYDPSSGAFDRNGNWVRQPFPRNIIPANRINPIAQKILSYYPAPNTTTPGQGYSIDDLFVPGGANPTTQNYYNIGLKIDQNIGDKHHFFFRYGQSRGVTNQIANGIKGPGLDGSYPYAKAGRPFILDWVGTMSPTFVVNATLSASRFTQGASGTPDAGFNITQLGFPQSLASQLPSAWFGNYQLSNYINVGRFNDLNTTNNWGFQTNISKVKGPHTIRAGTDLRWIQWGNESPGTIFQLTSSAAFTQRVYNVPDSTSGNSVVSWLLGTPSGGQAQIQPFTLNLERYFAPWVQDDWKVTNTLTLNLGLRWDFNIPPHERYNRLNRGFDTSTVSPINSLINGTQFPGTPPIVGGLLFAGVGGQPAATSATDFTDVQPRFGFAYQPFQKMVLRGGLGRYYLNQDDADILTNGFSTSNSVISSLDNMMTPLSNVISNPFPTGLQQPPGASLGLATFAGKSFSFTNTKYRMPYVYQFSFGLQYELPKRSMIDVSYVGSRSNNLFVSRPADNYSLAFRQSCDPMEGGNPGYCDAQVPNPFQGLAPFTGTSLYTAPTVTRSQLALPFPQFTGLTEVDENDGKMWYNSLQAKYDMRVTSSLNLLATYTFSKQIQQQGWDDIQRGIMQRSLYVADHPHRITLASVYQLPFGPNRKWLNSSNAFLTRMFGGWEINANLVYESGVPWTLPTNVIYVHNASVPNINWSAPVVRAVQPCVATYNNNGTITMQPYSVADGCTTYDFLIVPEYYPQVAGNDPTTSPGTSPRNAPNIRLQTAPQLDAALDKTVIIKERLRFQFRAEFFNATNTYVYNISQFNNNPNDSSFGTINPATAQNTNNPRYIQLGLKLLW